MSTLHHRKIELQSPKDLQYLRDSVARAARSAIDLHLPPSATLVPPAPAPSQAGQGGKHGRNEAIGNDPLRRRVEELVAEYVRSTFELASYNITINGLDAHALAASTGSPPLNADPDAFLSTSPTSSSSEYEPYDPRLASRVQALHAALEQETLAVAQLRREAPARAAEKYRQECAALDASLSSSSSFFSPAATAAAAAGAAGVTMEIDASGADEEGVALQQQHRQREDVQIQKGMLDLETIAKAMPRRDEVSQTWERGLQDLVALKATMPGTAAKLERAKAAVDYVQSR
ncbi:MAG: hypothetical protein M1825_000062 [Sarcosagium campestre]|nr:MAG: hypothetical protein M1825_000062 [Sarcosagium campestre]